MLKLISPGDCFLLQDKDAPGRQWEIVKINETEYRWEFLGDQTSQTESLVTRTENCLVSCYAQHVVTETVREAYTAQYFNSQLKEVLK